MEERPEYCVPFRTPKGITFASLNPETGLPYNEVAGELIPEPFAENQEDSCQLGADGFCDNTAITFDIEVEIIEEAEEEDARNQPLPQRARPIFSDDGVH